jgi:hypothetical protein
MLEFIFINYAIIWTLIFQENHLYKTANLQWNFERQTTLKLKPVSSLFFWHLNGPVISWSETLLAGIS